MRCRSRGWVRPTSQSGLGPDDCCTAMVSSLTPLSAPPGNGTCCARIPFHNQGVCQSCRVVEWHRVDLVGPHRARIEVKLCDPCLRYHIKGRGSDEVLDGAECDSRLTSHFVRSSPRRM